MEKADEIVESLLSEDALFELANVQPADTGLRHLVWISDNSETKHHRPRMKVQGTDKKLYPVSVDDPIEFLAKWPTGWSAKDFQDLQQFITLNRAVIMAHWNKTLGSKDALNQLQSIRQ